MQGRTVERDALQLARAALQETAHRDHIPLLNGGMRTDKSPGELALNEAVDIEGLHLVAGRLVVDTGYAPVQGTYLGTAQGTLEAFFNDGTSALLLVTTQTLYTYNSTALQWQLVSLNVLHTTTAGYGAGAATFALNSVADIVLNGYVGITLDNEQQLITYVTAIVGLNITTHDAVPVGRTVANGAVVDVAIKLNGDPTRSQVVAEVFPGNDWVVITNGIDPVMYYFLGVVKVLPGLPANTTCGTLTVFHASLMLGNLTENGTHFPARVRGSDSGDPTGWVPGTNGIAAIYNLLDSDDAVRQLLRMGPWLLCYRAGTTMRGSYIGDPNQVVFWEYMLQQCGVLSQNAVAPVGVTRSGKHFLVANSGIHLYAGGYDTEEIGEAVFQNFLAAAGDLNAAASGTLFAKYVVNLDEVWVFYPHNASTVPDKMLRVNLKTKAWSVRMFADTFLACGDFFPLSGTTWSQAKGQWNSAQWVRPWNSATLTKNIPSMLLCPAVAGASEQLQVYDYASITDNGVTVSWTLTTKQLGDGRIYMRWERAVILARGNSVLVEFSQDTGQTWQSLGTLNFGTTEVSVQQVFIDTVSTRAQLRLSGTDPTFQLRYIDVDSLIESEW